MLNRALPLLALLFITLPARAVPPPIELTRHRGKLTDIDLPPRVRHVFRSPASFIPPLEPLEAVGATDVKAVRYDISFDPVSGAVSAKLEIDLGAATTASVSAFAFYVDDGLSVSAASAPASTVTPSSQVYSPFKVVALAIDPPIAPGTTRTLSIDYGGKLNCSAQQDQQSCSFGNQMPFILEGSVTPALIDAAGFGGYNIWGATRSLTLRLPSTVDVVATGVLADESDDGTTKMTRWETPGYQSVGGFLAVMGDFDQTSADGTSVATNLHGLASSPAWSAEMASWMQTILPFIDQQAGKPLPYTTLNVIKIPAGSSFRGTAGHAITLLNEDYAAPGPRYFEETLAHENAHQWWGVLVSPTDALVTRWLTEGLATLSQVDYTAAQRVPAAEREAYFARRYREHRVLVRYHTAYETFPPLVVADPNQQPAVQPDHTIWAYIRSSAILESFRAAIGDSVFAKVLQAYAAKCSMARCNTTDFSAVLESESGVDFDKVFTGWVYESHFPRLVVGFSQELGSDGSHLTVQLSDEGGIWTPLELWIELEDGSIERRRILVGPGQTTHELTLPRAVRSVRPNPRHDAAVWSRSAQAGDLDFDREVDGFDLIQCARAFGRGSALTGGVDEGILGVDLDFDPRCDIDESGIIDDSDLKPTLDAFGTVKESG